MPATPASTVQVYDPTASVYVPLRPGRRRTAGPVLGIRVTVTGAMPPGATFTLGYQVLLRDEWAPEPGEPNDLAFKLRPGGRGLGDRPRLLLRRGAHRAGRGGRLGEQDVQPVVAAAALPRGHDPRGHDRPAGLREEHRHPEPVEDRLDRHRRGLLGGLPGGRRERRAREPSARCRPGAARRVHLRRRLRGRHVRARRADRGDEPGPAARWRHGRPGVGRARHVHPCRRPVPDHARRPRPRRPRLATPASATACA